MDTIYSNKKYLQNISAAEYYRRPANEYASYHNTMSRRSLFGSHYTHQPNISKYKYSYPSDVSLSSHYGYTSWGLWRDAGHLSPSVYSKKRINIRSFSILIMSAAFIVLLAVLSVAGLAFYFSTFKSDPSESMLVFDCAYRIAKGDIWVSQLKNNTSPLFRQKAAFYTKFIETSLEHGNFNVAKTDLMGFGNGPDIQLSFRIYLDMRKIQITITNVEEHIKNAFISETVHSDSTFRHIKIDIDSIEIKRQLDPDVLQKAALFREQLQEPSSSSAATTMSTTVIPLADDDFHTVSKKIGISTEKTKVKSSTSTSSTFKGSSISSSNSNNKRKDTRKPILHESDIDMENLPVIQGSFEITKTDADIAQKRSDIRPASTQSLMSSTLKPFYISPASSIKVKSNGQSASVATTTIKGDNIVEMFLQHQKNLQQQAKESAPVTAKIEKTNKNGATTKINPVTENLSVSTTPTSITSSSSSSSSSTETTTSFHLEYNESQINKDLPKLDVSLFTSAPILDNEPWRPINPSPEQTKANFPTTDASLSLTSSTSTSSLSTEMPPYRSPFDTKPMENVLYRNKFVDPDMIYPVNDTDESVLYQSFYNPDFSAGSLEIEKLGIADVKPYPLPVNKIDLSEEINVPDFRPLKPDNEKLPIDNTKVNYDEDKFEHLGDGVIAKKPEMNESSTAMNAITANGRNDTLDIIHDDINSLNVTVNVEGKNDTVAATNLDDIFQDLLNDSASYNKTMKDELESRIVPDEYDENDDDENNDDDDDGALTTTEEKILTTTQKLNFLNMKNFIVQRQQNKSNEFSSLTSAIQESTSVPTTFEMISDSGARRTTVEPTTTFVEVNTAKHTLPSTSATTASEPQLFPSISKWEFVNGTRANMSQHSATKKVFNETLQAVIVENAQATPHVTYLDDLKANRTVDKANLQQLSSIFDTLATKLGIKPDVSSKLPPFSQQAQHKLKQNGNRIRTTTTTRGTSSNSTSKNHLSTLKTTSTPRQPMTTVKTTSGTFGPSSFSSETVIGQAEVEAVDPTQYEEILSMASSPFTKIVSTTPSLVTLMPVKSNSGIRNFNPRVKLPSRPQSSSTSSEAKNLETVVKAQMSFDS